MMEGNKMILGREVIVISVDKARLLLNELTYGRTKEVIQLQQESGVLTVIEELRSAVKDVEMD